MRNDELDKDYTEMNEDELNAELDAMLAEHKRSGRVFQKQGDLALQIDRTVPISMRVPSRLLQRLRDDAARRQMPYQRLMLKLIEAGLDAEEGHTPPPTITVPVDAEALSSGHIVLDLVTKKA